MWSHNLQRYLNVRHVSNGMFSTPSINWWFWYRYSQCSRHILAGWQPRIRDWLPLWIWWQSLCSADAGLVSPAATVHRLTNDMPDFLQIPSILVAFQRHYRITSHLAAHSITRINNRANPSCYTWNSNHLSKNEQNCSQYSWYFNLYQIMNEITGASATSCPWFLGNTN